MAENKTKPTSASVDDFIAAIENNRRRADTLIALQMYKQITGFSPVMWVRRLLVLDHVIMSMTAGARETLQSLVFHRAKHI